MFENFKKGFFPPILWTLNKISTVTGLISYIYDYWSDIELSIHFSQNCNYTYQFWTLAFVAFYILILWGDGVRLSYINNENSETWPFKWMLFFGWCHPLYYLSSKTIKGCS